jgi:hypothetical protein
VVSTNRHHNTTVNGHPALNKMTPPIIWKITKRYEQNKTPFLNVTTPTIWIFSEPLCSIFTDWQNYNKIYIIEDFFCCGQTFLLYGNHSSSGDAVIHASIPLEERIFHRHRDSNCCHHYLEKLNDAPDHSAIDPWHLQFHLPSKTSLSTEYNFIPPDPNKE